VKTKKNIAKKMNIQKRRQNESNSKKFNCKKQSKRKRKRKPNL
jgi:hypothetical protein